MSNRENASLIMASCRPRAPLAAADRPRSAAANSAVAAAAPTLPIPPTPDAPRGRLDRESLPRTVLGPSLFARLPGGCFCCRESEEPLRGGGSAVELRRLCIGPFLAVSPVPAAMPSSPPAAAKSLESWRSAAARPGALCGAAVATAVAGMASMAASRSAFLRHKNASVAESRAGNRKFAVPTCSQQRFRFVGFGPNTDLTLLGVVPKIVLLTHGDTSGWIRGASQTRKVGGRTWLFRLINWLIGRL